MIYIWICILLMVASVALPILRLLGVIKWDWKIVFAPIWVPLVAIFSWVIWFMVPILFLSVIVLVLTGGQQI